MELSRFRDATGKFTETNTAILGVSVDSTWANKAFREQLGAEFPILSDSRKDVSRRYGVLNEDSGFARRTTFVIDTAGVVRHIDQDRAAMDPATAMSVCRLIKEP
jgi:peroxiredoxin (alkyl hydroperoxide reductase subunit C)